MGYSRFWRKVVCARGAFGHGISFMPFHSDDIVLGSCVDATVSAIKDDHILFDFDEGHVGFLPGADSGRKQKPEVAVGDVLRLFVDHKSAQSGHYVLSKDKADRLGLLDTLERAYRDGAPVEGEVVADMEGGFSVDIGLKAFLPSSQFALRPVRDVDGILGQRFQFRIIRFHPRRNNIVLSRRVLLEEDKDRALKTIRTGAIIEGTVTSLTDYGAFVDIDGAEGLLHVNDISWSRVKDVSSVLTQGQKLTVKVLKFDKKGGRLSLGLKQLEDDPWFKAESKYPVGSKAKGVVVSRTDYGYFIEVESGLEGLLLAGKDARLPASEAKVSLKNVEIGQEIEVEVLGVDRATRRMSLGPVGS